jgi:4-carboxymuconolactone decarboxylase
MDQNYLEKGLAQRKATLGEEYVDNVFANADDFSRPFQEAMTSWCWGFGWGDDVIDPKTRSMMNLTMIAALNRMEEFELHFRGAIKNGVTKDELRAILHVISIYCGVPAGVACFRIAKRILAEEGL